MNSLRKTDSKAHTEEPVVKSLNFVNEPTSFVSHFPLYPSLYQIFNSIAVVYLVWWIQLLYICIWRTLPK